MVKKVQKREVVTHMYSLELAKQREKFLKSHGIKVKRVGKVLYTSR